MSASVEEYLEALYTLTEGGQPAGTSSIARHLNVAPASASEMMKKLAGGGYVEYLPYQGAALTDKGFAVAEKMARKHRLLERFLHDMLHIRKEKLHDEACAMEHSLSDSTERALCQKLEAPDRCPDDGKLIPACGLGFSSCDQCRQSAQDGLEEVGGRRAGLVAVASMKEDQCGHIAFIRGSNKSLRRLLDLGLTPGTKVRVVRVAPLKGPIEIALRGSKLALGEQIARNVFVEAVAAGAETGQR